MHSSEGKNDEQVERLISSGPFRHFARPRTMHFFANNRSTRHRARAVLRPPQCVRSDAAGRWESPASGPGTTAARSSTWTSYTPSSRTCRTRAEIQQNIQTKNFSTRKMLLTAAHSAQAATETAHFTRSVVVVKRRDHGQKWDPSGIPIRV